MKKPGEPAPESAKSKGAEFIPSARKRWVRRKCEESPVGDESALAFKEQCPQGRQRERHGIRTPVHRFGMGVNAAEIPHPAPSVILGTTVQQSPPIPTARNPHPISRSRHRREVEHPEHHV